jgi:pentatricopeptide repeat protein
MKFLSTILAQFTQTKSANGKPLRFWHTKALVLALFAMGLLAFSLHTFSGLFTSGNQFQNMQKNFRVAENAYTNGQYEKTIDAAYTARNLAIGINSTENILDAVLLEAKARLLLNDAAEGTKLLQDAIALATQAQSPLFFAKTYTAVMDVYAKQGEYVKAITASKQVVHYYTQATQPKEAARLIMVLADKIVLAEPKAATIAVQLYEESLEIYKATNDYLLIGLVRERMGAALLQTDRQKAISYYLDAMEVYKTIDNTERRDAIYKTIDSIDPQVLPQYYD